ncbi:PEP/pyruvate-binding domain-containing protein [Microbacter sp. GSS18]|nr:PEP/pyruvate-binding domain-containing protein [Microbacter sp. GSS18]
MTDDWCLPLADLTAADLDTAGGKGANLGELVRAGFAVPAGFVVTTGAYRDAVAGIAGPAHDTVLAAEMPEAVRDGILSRYAELGEGRVAVRSSATAEDLPGAAFAGQQDTFLGIEGPDALLDAVRRCWASLWTERAIAYRARLGVDDGTVSIAVVVQRMVPADLAGVMFTADPVTGARDRVVIDSNPGLGEAVVSGLVTPDHAVVGADGRVIERHAGRAETVIRESAAGGTETVSTPVATRLTDTQLSSLADHGRRIAAHFGRPQDIEWAVVGDRISILQARPMTALPPAPIALTRRQRITGPVILELVPRRPYPMEVSAWIEPNVGPHVEKLVGGVVGARFSLRDVLPAEDAIVQQFIPPNPEPTRRVPKRIVRTLSRLGRDPRAWFDDPRRARFQAEVDALAARDLGRAAWAQLLDMPAEAGSVSDLMTDLRVEYLPAAGGAMVRLRMLLTLLRRRELFSTLILDAKTATQEANAALAGIADRIRAAGLADRATGLDGPALYDLVRSEPVAGDVREALDDFLGRFGHRETSSVLLPKDPTWSDSPETVMALVAVMLDGDADARPDHDAAAAAALDAVLRHPLIRRTHSEDRVRRLVHKASAGVTVREDTHFELTRTMPVVRDVIAELGRRLTDAGAIDDAGDIWFLTLEDLRGLRGPDDARADLRAIVERRRAAFAELAGSSLIAPTTLYPDLGRGDVDGALANGVGGGGGRASGPVRIVQGPDEFATLRAGEVLVCPATNPAWTPLFARAAAVVVDNGGLASHAAIVAREYGIAAVMGTGTGTAVLTTGQRVIVDGDRGVVLAEDDSDGRG